MPRIAQPFLSLLSTSSAGGSSITTEELSAALAQTTVQEACTFAARAIDTLAEGELVQLISRKAGPGAIPAALSSLRDHAASAAWLAGDLSPGADSAEARAATVLMQRALIKIGAHHAGGRALPALLQLPWGADGDAGALTLAAVNAALDLTGAEASVASVADLGPGVAQVLESLLEATPATVHPAVLDAQELPRRARVLYVGMGDYSRAEASAIARMLPRRSDLIWVGDSRAGDDIIALEIDGQATTYDLTQPDQLQRFCQEAFAGTLSQRQQELVRQALEAGAWSNADSRDEVAAMALAFHDAHRPDGGVQLEQLFISGHSASSGVWGDSNGELSMASLAALVEAFPTAARGVRTVFFAACNHLHKRNVTELLGWFPDLQVAGGYSDYAPGTWTGGISHCQAWETLYLRAKQAGQPVITAEDMVRRLSAVGGMARRKMHHIATWCLATGQYSTYRDASASDADPTWEQVVEQLGGDATRAAALETQLQGLVPELQQLLAGTHPTLDLRQVKPDDDTVARQVYGLAGDLAGETGATAAQATYAETWRARSLAARFYGRVLEKFCAAPNILARMQTANTELAAAGATVRAAAELQDIAFGRAQMMAHIHELEGLVAVGGLSEAAASYVALLGKMIGKLEGIPNTWV